jgi:ABC-type uncharacterized transport system permease subunit
MIAEDSGLDLVSAVLIFSASIVPAYMSLKLKGSTRKLTFALTAFIIVHGIYHLARMQGLKSIADNVLEPASIVILIVFGVAYLNISRKKQQEMGR